MNWNIPRRGVLPPNALLDVYEYLLGEQEYRGPLSSSDPGYCLPLFCEEAEARKSKEAAAQIREQVRQHRLDKARKARAEEQAREKLAFEAMQKKLRRLEAERSGRIIQELKGATFNAVLDYLVAAQYPALVAIRTRARKQLQEFQENPPPDMWARYDLQRYLDGVEKSIEEAASLLRDAARQLYRAVQKAEISVHKTDTSEEFGLPPGTMGQNVRYATPDEANEINRQRFVDTKRRSRE